MAVRNYQHYPGPVWDSYTGSGVGIGIPYLATVQVRFVARASFWPTPVTFGRCVSAVPTDMPRCLCATSTCSHKRRGLLRPFVLKVCSAESCEINTMCISTSAGCTLLTRLLWFILFRLISICPAMVFLHSLSFLSRL